MNLCQVNLANSVKRARRPTPIIINPTTQKKKVLILAIAFEPFSQSLSCAFVENENIWSPPVKLLRNKEIEVKSCRLINQVYLKIEVQRFSYFKFKYRYTVIVGACLHAPVGRLLKLMTGCGSYSDSYRGTTLGHLDVVELIHRFAI